MVRVLALDWKERYHGDRLALEYCGELGTARRSDPCELAWTWCMVAYREIGDTVTHCYLTLAPLFLENVEKYQYGGMPGA